VAKNYQREKTLHDKGLTSTSVLESTEQSLLGSNMTVEQIRSSLANAKIQMAQIHNTISELKLQKEQERQQSGDYTLISMGKAQGRLSREWEQTYLLQSPIEGNCVIQQPVEDKPDHQFW
jgi:hypothetical protein